ncbi:hexose transporter hxt5 [Saitoella coloradoensis]
MTAADHGKQQNNSIVIFLIFASMSGWMFGADTGTISGLINMDNYLQHFGDIRDSATGVVTGMSNVRQGLVVGMVNIGTLIGCLLSSPIADGYGKRISVMFWCAIYLVGIVLQISATNSWVHVMVARIVTGLGIGALSVVTPSYQSETAPKSVRGTVVTTYQLFVTLGIFVGYCINYGTESRPDTGSWRIPIGINFLWGIILGVGMLFLPESPRYLLKVGREKDCRRVLAKMRGTNEDDENVEADYQEIARNLEKEMAGGSAGWSEVFGKRVRYRTFLGMAVMSFQQLCGANYFFYYGTSIFTGIQVVDSPFVAQIILGVVNFVCTFGGLYVLERFGRRTPLIIGALWMFVCFLIFSSVGNYKLYGGPNQTDPNKSAGIAMIVFACFYILGFATTWAPAAYVIVGESYPLRVRSKCAGLATACNFGWNFLISFFTPFITGAIGFKYGYVFAACCFASAVIIFFFAKETKGLSLEQIDVLYASDIKPWQSVGFLPEHGFDTDGNDGNDDKASDKDETAAEMDTYQDPYPKHGHEDPKAQKAKKVNRAKYGLAPRSQHVENRSGEGGSGSGSRPNADVESV